MPDFKSVGVKNNARCFEYMVIIRAINTINAMTATIERIDWDVLQKITERILAQVANVNRVCYDMSPKPPATIWNWNNEMGFEKLVFMRASSKLV